MAKKHEDESVAVLSKSWYRLRLSTRCPSRVPTWDAILLTAASPQQASLYQWHLDRAKRMGTIEASTIAMAVPDPNGIRIGSGGATLHAIRSLAYHLSTTSQAEASILRSNETSACISKMSTLLVHAGGDSKRVPWANPMGKAFLPLPFLADEDPDRLTPCLFDHILAISSSAVEKIKNKGGLFIMTGDVLPLFDFSHLVTPEDGACVVTVPATIEVAANHGVIVASSLDDINHVSCKMSMHSQGLELVVDLLQKPTPGKLVDCGAMRKDGTVLLDTGIFTVVGQAWNDLVELAIEELDPTSVLVQDRKEVSLYEELAAAWVPACHKWLETRPLGRKLLKFLSSQTLFSYCARRAAILSSFWD